MFPSGTLCYSENKNQVYAHTLVSPHQPPILLIIRLLASLILDMSMIQRKSREFHRQLRVNKNIGRSTNSLLIKKAKEPSENITLLFRPFICIILFISGKQCGNILISKIPWSNLDFEVVQRLQMRKIVFLCNTGSDDYSSLWLFADGCCSSCHMPLIMNVG